jgi:hypothetical protein
MRRFVSIAGTAAALCVLAACGTAPPAAAPHTSTPASTTTYTTTTSAAPTSLTGPPPPAIDVDSKYLPSWMQGVADGSSDPMANGMATLRMASVESDLVQHGLGSLQELPYFPARVVRQCTELNAGVADPDGEAVTSFSIPQHPLTTADGAQINAAIRPDCA